MDPPGLRLLILASAPERTMNSPYNRTHRFSPTGIATASILLVTLVMVASLVFDRPVANPPASTTVVQATAHMKG